jgi:hypothetical protein
MDFAPELEEVARRVARSVAEKIHGLEPLEDLEQEARLAVYLAAVSWDSSKAPLIDWCAWKARNACIDYVRVQHGSLPLISMPLEDEESGREAGELGISDRSLERVDQLDSHKKARRIQRRMEREEKPEKPKERVGGPGQLGGPVTVCGILFERVHRGVLLTLPNGQTASTDLLTFRHAMNLLLGDKPRNRKDKQ